MLSDVVRKLLNGRPMTGRGKFLPFAQRRDSGGRDCRRDAVPLWTLCFIPGAPLPISSLNGAQAAFGPWRLEAAFYAVPAGLLCIVVEPAGDDRQLSRRRGVDEAMLVGDPARPVPCQVGLEWLRLADALERARRGDPAPARFPPGPLRSTAADVPHWRGCSGDRESPSRSCTRRGAGRSPDRRSRSRRSSAPHPR